MVETHLTPHAEKGWRVSGVRVSGNAPEAEVRPAGKGWKAYPTPPAEETPACACCCGTFSSSATCASKPRRCLPVSTSQSRRYLAPADGVRRAELVVGSETHNDAPVCATRYHVSAVGVAGLGALFNHTAAVHAFGVPWQCPQERSPV